MTKKADVVAIMDNRAKAIIRSQTQRSLALVSSDHILDMKISYLQR